MAPDRSLILVALAGIIFGHSVAAEALEITDLKLLDVSIFSQSEIPKRDKFWSEGVIVEPLIKVTIQTNTDLQAAAEAGGYNIDNITTQYDEPSLDLAQKMEGFPDVLDGNGRIDAYRKVGGGKSGPPPFIYHVYFALQERGVSLRNYDLARAPSNVCIALGGAQESYFWITGRVHSNTLVVPRIKIESLVSQARIKL